MPLSNYGVLVGRAVERRREPGQDTPHYQIKLAAGGEEYRIAVNVQSAQAPSELRYVVYEDYAHPILADLLLRPDGWHPIASVPGGSALDFIRGNLLDRNAMRLLPADVPGEANDLADLLDAHVLRAIGDAGATIYAFGEPWGPEAAKPDKIFGFEPGRGVHNVHMNQGNSQSFAADDGVWQDGALLLHFPDAARWVAVFLAFQSQAWHTDDATGHALDGQSETESSEARIMVVAALVNPLGPAPEAETVTVLNASASGVDLAGWALVDRAKNRHPLPAVQLDPGETLRVGVAPPFALGNKGGAITVLDPDGLKVHGVAYTSAQVRREGWTVVP